MSVPTVPAGAAIAAMAKRAFLLGGWLWALSAVCVFAMDSAQAATSIDVAAYFPFTPGNAWRYKVYGRAVTRTVGAPMDFHGAKVQPVLDKPGYAGNASGDKSYLSFDAKGLRRHGAQTQVSLSGVGVFAASEVDTPPIVYLKAKATLGDAVSSAGRARLNYAGLGTFDFTYAARATPEVIENVSTLAATFAKTLRVHVVTTYRGHMSIKDKDVAMVIVQDEILWFSHGVGVVKYRQSLSYTAQAEGRAKLMGTRLYPVSLLASPLVKRHIDEFAFNQQSQRTPGTLVVSEPVTLSGFTIGYPLHVYGGEYSLDGGPFTTATGAVHGGEQVRVRVRAPTASAALASATLKIGSALAGGEEVASQFIVTTAMPQGSHSALYFNANHPTLGAALVVEGQTLPGGGTAALNVEEYTDDPGNPRPYNRFGGAFRYGLGGALRHGRWGLGRPRGVPLQVGIFTNATMPLESDTINWLMFTVNSDDDVSGGETCWSHNGRVVVLDAGFDESGRLARLAANFEQTCADFVGALKKIDGQVRYHSTFPIDVEYRFPPNAFSFPALSGQAFFTPLASNTVKLNGIGSPPMLRITGGRYRLNGGPYTAVAAPVKNGDLLQVEVVTAGDGEVERCATVTIGGLDTPFCATTAAFDAPLPFVLPPATGVTFNSVVTSAALVVEATTALPASVSGGAFSVNGGPFSANGRTVRNGDSIRVQVTSAGGSAGEHCAELTLGGVNAPFCATTFTHTPADPRRLLPLILDD